MLEAVLFDIDGTLVDSVDLHASAWQDAFAHWGKTIPFQEIRNQIGKGADQLMPVFLSPDEFESFGEDMKTWRTDHYLLKYMPQVRAFAGAKDLLIALRERGLRVGLATSAREEELARLKQILGVEDDLVQGEINADDVQRSKPHPDIFAAALEEVGSPDREHAVAVGDTPYDAEAARKAGIRTIGVLCGGFPESMLRQAGCIAIYRDPADLLERLEESPLAS